MSNRGFGVAAAIAPEFVPVLAVAAESAGYSTFWVNDTPDADGLEALAQAAARTSTIRLGVGVIPLDRRNALNILADVERLHLPLDRLIIGVGSGAKRVGGLKLVSKQLDLLKSASSAKVVVGALGPKMINIGAGGGDGVLLNWLTPSWSIKSRDLAQAAVSSVSVEVDGYVRVALPSGEERVQAEANRYASIPQYGDHFVRMGVTARQTCVVGSSAEIQAGLKPFDDVLDETVVRAIVGVESLNDYLELIEAAKPTR